MISGKVSPDFATLHPGYTAGMYKENHG